MQGGGRSTERAARASELTAPTLARGEDLDRTPAGGRWCVRRGPVPRGARGPRGEQKKKAVQAARGRRGHGGSA